MSAHPHTVHIPATEQLVPGKLWLTKLFAILAVFGIALSVLGALVDDKQFAYSWFTSYYFYFTIALGSFFWVVLHHATNACWTVLVRRVWENVLALFPLFFVLLIPLLLPHYNALLWKWMSPYADAHELEARSYYLNSGFFYTRLICYFFYFCLAGLYYRRCSILQDRDGNPVYSRRMHDHSYVALVIFGVLETFISFDWYMGLDWRWSSSLFGAYNFGVCIQAGMAAGIVLMAIFRAGGFLRGLNSEHFHLMGKLLFGFTILWAYFAFGQYLLIWFANIPEETVFYNNHNRGEWIYLTYFMVVGKFMFPMFYLLSQDAKKSLKALSFIAAWILFMHGVEIYWFVAPFAHASIIPNWQDLVAFVTMTSILGYTYIQVASKSALFPIRDPRLVECLTISN